jgi:hypothetical protein
MKKNFISVLLCLFPMFMSAAPNSQASDSSSFYNAILEKQTSTAEQQGQSTPSPSAANIHIREQYNSLSHAVLAKQGVKQNILINSASQISYSPIDPTSERNNSLSHGALAKQFENTL